MKRLMLVPLMLAGLSGLVGCDSDTKNTVSQRSYVLVHGAWMGAWCWDDVAAGLRATGSTVTTVELPAHGSDQTPIQEATLDAYATKVRAVVEASPTPVVLVGHSMGGVVITAVGETSSAKIAKLVYLGAYVPGDGQSLNDLASTDSQSHLGPVLQIDASNGVARIPTDSLADVFIADGTAAEIALVTSNYRDEPLAPFVTPVHTTPAGWGAIDKAYVFTTEDHAVSYGLQQTMAAAASITATASVDTSHAPFLSKPDMVVSTLRGI